MIRDEKIGGFLDRLASGEPTPGGGAAGALQAAQGAALLSMAANFTSGPEYAEHAERTARILAAARDLIPAALELADADEQSFHTVADAYALPDGTDEETQARTRTVQKSLARAAEPPRKLVELAGEILRLGQELAGFSNPNVLSDIGAAAEAARAAASSGRVTLEINIADIKDQQTLAALEPAVAEAGRIINGCEELSARIRSLINGRGGP
ncbi:cyclodeaminase/cyclohydrolase family protein [Arthrobacter sp. VKM Ac-2550]|uniref:cyclodeaminase/cyclohydrolase family protein n=1 Tax=Crystallibacter permensis TaxID=1938888 RepID=UPI002226F525|nr:cyclodeaminase/cyclohydrolase family protein [Arthrobacter sp. VKM Ac-2550]MCW2134640.1 Formiminotetrahydrofolate cyclodeaminase [Arthrobacter sp. VKM Ac-2550]